MVEESQGQGGLDGEIRVAPLPTPPVAPAGRPASDRLRGQPHRHIAASNECAVVGRPVRNAVLCLVPGMDLRLHPCSVAPAEGPEKCAPPPQGLHATTPCCDWTAGRPERTAAAPRLCVFPSERPRLGVLQGPPTRPRRFAQLVSAALLHHTRYWVVWHILPRSRVLRVLFARAIAWAD